MTTTHVSGRDATDNLSRIAIANVAAVAGGHRDPSWLLPTPMYQPYCRLHFLKECAIYHLQGNESLKRMVETRTAKPTKPGKWPAAPTRIQPARRAREKSLKDRSRASVNSRNSSPARGDQAGHSSTTLESWGQKLQLHLPWPVYKTKIEAEIMGYSSKFIRDGQQEGSNWSSSECRYCRFDPEIIDCEGSAPRKLAPPAPMHFIQPSDMKNAQMMEFGGLKFVVDITNGHKTIALLEMDRMEDFPGYPVRAQLMAESSSVDGVKSRKRSLATEFAESDEPVGTMLKKRRGKKGT
ncbi:hypothetical protein F5B19DRAFT_399136 [Rostrohypoxylon terebratum]|nr:hypothetical protein F5B19DRAFT_399136 [Rostrohypoxylon terebratum]